MFVGRSRFARRAVALASVGALAATGLALPALSTFPASADTLDANVATVTAVAASPAFPGQTTGGLVSGQVVNVHADRVGSNLLYSIQARVCADNSNITFDADFNPTAGGLCASAPLAGGTDNSVTTSGTPGGAPVEADLSFRVGSGTNTYTTQASTQATVQCDFTHPCELWIKVSTSAGSAQYKHFDLTFAGDPDAPTGVSVTPGSTQADVSWTAPVNTGNAPVSSYTVTATPTSGTPVVQTGVTGTSTTITGLDDFTEYSFTVSANTIGAFASPDSSSASGTPVPSPPTSLAGTVGDGEVNLEWTAPTTPGVTDYQISYIADGGSMVTVLTGSVDLDYTITGLVNGTRYTVTIAAVYAAGTTEESASIELTPDVIVEEEEPTGPPTTVGPVDSAPPVSSTRGIDGSDALRPSFTG
jgi:hypothetical protein